MDEKERLAEFEAIKGLFGALIESLDNGQLTAFDIERIKRRSSALLQVATLKRQQIRLQQYLAAVEAYERSGREGLYDSIASWTRTARSVVLASKGVACG